MTMYGINDNDIMDEVIVSDMISASNACKNPYVWCGKDSWFEDSTWREGGTSGMVSELIDMEYFGGGFTEAIEF